MEHENRHRHPETADQRSRGWQDGFEAETASLQLSSRHVGLIPLHRWVVENEIAALRLSLKEAATIACLEPCYFSKVFHHVVGSSFRQWRLQYRIAWAIFAMRRGEHTLVEIIEHSGYHDRRAFERAFRKVTGKTPGKLHREADRSRVRLTPNLIRMGNRRCSRVCLEPSPSLQSYHPVMTED